jgi:hypothetical protein
MAMRMRTRKEFLEFVLPSTGNYCLWVNKGDVIKQELFTSIDALLGKVDGWVKRDYNVFFAVSSFQTLANRKAANVEAIKCLYLDLDVGDDNKEKKYETTEDAMVALKKFVKDTGFPKPNIVKSGRGLHVYWVFDQELPPAEWKPYANAFKKLCFARGLRIDPTVPADAARVLRVPETFHVKDVNNPIPVQILIDADASSLAQIKSILGEVANVDLFSEIPDHIKHFGIDETTRLLLQNREFYFSDILEKSLAGNGCAQIRKLYETRATADYDLWIGGLSIANKCEDRDYGIEAISEGHKDYDFETASSKAATFGGAQSCEVFKRNNPTGCEGCPHKISGPIQLGLRIKEAEGETEVVEVDAETKKEKTYIIPEYPFPYFKGQNGGVYRKVSSEEDAGAIPQKIYSYPFYVVKRIDDVFHGESVQLRLHKPKDGVRDFILPLSTIVSIDRFRDAVAKEGVAVFGKHLNEIMAYITKWVEHLQNTTKADKGVAQLGWQEEDETFVVGDRRLYEDRIEYCPPSGALLTVSPAFHEKGEFHVWKNIINYFATPGMEYRALTLFSAFGCPLQKFDPDIDGFIFNLYSQEGGAGKTTTIYTALSVSGHPKEQMIRKKDTENFIYNRLGTIQNLVAGMDEITAKSPEEKYNLCYDVTDGKGKNRLRGSDNMERVNKIKWSTSLLTSSNNPLDQSVSAVSGNADAVLSRMLCIEAPHNFSMSLTESSAHFTPLMQNYGHAITPYMQYVLGHKQECIALANEIRTRLEQKAGVISKERYWGGVMSKWLAGGIIANRLGLHDIPTKPVFNFVVDTIIGQRERNKNLVTNMRDVLTTFLYKNIDKMVIANGNSDRRTGLEQAALQVPRGRALAIRFEPDTKRLYVSIPAFREQLTFDKLSVEEALAPHKKTKSLIETKVHRLGSGTQYSQLPPTRCYVFDVTKIPDFDIEAIRSATDSQPSSNDSVEEF